MRNSHNHDYVGRLLTKNEDIRKSPDTHPSVHGPELGEGVTLRGDAFHGPINSGPKSLGDFD